MLQLGGGSRFTVSSRELKWGGDIYIFYFSSLYYHCGKFYYRSSYYPSNQSRQRHILVTKIPVIHRKLVFLGNSFFPKYPDIRRTICQTKVHRYTECYQLCSIITVGSYQRSSYYPDNQVELERYFGKKEFPRNTSLRCITGIFVTKIFLQRDQLDGSHPQPPLVY